MSRAAAVPPASGQTEEAPRGQRAVLARVRSLLPSLTPSEAAVARLLLGDPAGSVRLSVEMLAGRASVSTTTVMRLSQTLGFGGFKDLKLALAAELGSGVAVLPDPVRPGDSPLQIATKVFQADIEAIRQTLALLDEATFAAAVEELGGARKVEVYGVGSSAPIATDAYYRFLRIGLEVAAVTDSHMQAVSAGLLTPRDVALVVSHTGRTRETLSAAKEAKARGAMVIGLTSFFRTPLVELADLSLITATAETIFRAEAMASRIAHLSVIDALYVALATRRFEGALKALEHSGKIIEDKRV